MRSINLVHVVACT
ncbi:hypothetical protein F383_11898 [Gossypium arboreum]|uniref:Uncharacterized protein n=1 Tax=Gossypium arboreum TaxID=29729 RepID=A0A0B0PMJ0_GOSAR|nr:hypothetical protein F383_11898 [Gossypium arboreum]